VNNNTGGIHILRVIAGSAKGHKLRTLEGMATRPTSDRVKESMFNMLAPYNYDSDILDLFAGSGSLGIEALSRGARTAAFVDRSSECCKIIKDNLAKTKLVEKGQVFEKDFTSAVYDFAARGIKFDIILLDPPYNKNFIQETLKILTNNDIIRDSGILAAEHHIDDSLPEISGELKLTSRKNYGDTAISIYTK
jgi:16S rRNA (guanine(966)-N(2))-methyltransferase RsmD